jgi:hypothetical protein
MRCASREHTSQQTIRWNVYRLCSPCWHELVALVEKFVTDNEPLFSPLRKP